MHAELRDLFSNKNPQAPAPGEHSQVETVWQSVFLCSTTLFELISLCKKQYSKRLSSLSFVEVFSSLPHGQYKTLFFFLVVILVGCSPSFCFSNSNQCGTALCKWYFKYWRYNMFFFTSALVLE